MKIVHLINDTYQVVSNDEQTIFFQGSKVNCKNVVKINRLKAKAQSKLYHQTILQRNDSGNKFD